MARRLVDHTADVGFAVEGPDLAALLREAALALTELMTELPTVRPAEARSVSLAAAAPDLLLVEWLEELLYLVDAEGWLLADAELSVAAGEEGWRLSGTVRGERRDPGRHPHKVAVKAVTYHGLAVEHDSDGWRARVILDL